MIAWFLFGFMCAMVGIFAVAYAKFVTLQKAVKRAWLRLDISLKNRQDLVPSVCLLAAGVENLPKETSLQLQMLREKTDACPDIRQRMEYEQQISHTLREIFKAAYTDKNIAEQELLQHLCKGIISHEKRIQGCNKRYNNAARDLNTLADIIPINLIAKAMEIKEALYFDFHKSL